MTREVDRREYAIVTAILATPVVLALSALAVHDRPARPSAVGFLVVAGCIAIINFALSVIRPLVYRWRVGSLNGMRNVSGIPIVGSMAVVAAIVVAFGSKVVAIVGLALLVVDTGSAVWALAALIRGGDLRPS